MPNDLIIKIFGQCADRVMKLHDILREFVCEVKPQYELNPNEMNNTSLNSREN